VNSDRMRSIERARRKVASFLDVFAAGNEVDYGSPILGTGYDDPLSDKDSLRKVVGDKLYQSCDLATVQEFLRQPECLARLKHGSSSRYPPYTVPVTVGDSLESQVGKILVKHPDLHLKTRAGDAADRYVRRLFDSVKCSSLVPSPLMVAAASFDGKKNLGYPHFVSDRGLLSEYYERSWEIGNRGFPLDDALAHPGLIGARSVPRGPYSYAKTRFITQWSRVLGNWEKTLFIPLFDALSKSPTFCAWSGPEVTNVVITNFMRRSEGPVLSLDYTGFDASVPFEVIDRVFALIKERFAGWAASLVDFVHTGFKGSGLETPGRYINGDERRRGVPSGSVLTNLIGSLVNLWVMAYACSLNKGCILSAFVQGDDGVYTFRGIRSIANLASTILSEFGMVIKMDPSKNLISDREVMYLQMHHHRDYEVDGLFKGVRPVMRGVMNMMSHERAPMQVAGWSRKYNTYRMLQQANNCADHPRFEGLCVLLWSLDGYLKEALDKIQRGDREVYIANQLLDVGGGERGKLPVRELVWSPVVRMLNRIRA